MISANEFWILGTGVTVLVLAQVLLKAPGTVQQIRLFTVVCAGLSIGCTLAGWALMRLEAQPTLLETAIRAAMVAVCVALALCGMWIARSRLRPRGFQKRVTVNRAWSPASQRAGYRRVRP